MPPLATRLPLVALITTLLLGCQSDAVPRADTGSGYAVPIYARSADAQAVALGHFGAIPIEIGQRHALDLLSKPCGTPVAEVRSHTGRVGWVPVDDLPAQLQKQPCAGSTAQFSALQPSGAADKR